MTGFETYDISAWMIDGLAMHPIARPARPVGARRIASLISRIVVPAVAMGTLSVYAAQPVAQWVLDVPTRVELASIQNDLLPDIPSVYWSKAVVALRRAPLIEESGPADPPPRY